MARSSMASSACGIWAIVLPVNGSTTASLSAVSVHSLPMRSLGWFIISLYPCEPLLFGLRVAFQGHKKRHSEQQEQQDAQGGPEGHVSRLLELLVDDVADKRIALAAEDVVDREHADGGHEHQQ